MSAITKAIQRLAEARGETWYFGIENPDQVQDQGTFNSQVKWGIKDPGTNVVSWAGSAPCTWTDVSAYYTQAKQEEINSQYRLLRAPEYPSIGDQLDALWKGGEAATAMLAQIQAVKAKYPKPE